jgi:uncharacterized protein
VNIAVIGSGISGMTAAHFLSENHQVTLFESSKRLGGHTATIDVKKNGKVIAVDTGFIVFNDRTYPEFIALMDKLGVQSQPSCMSFGVSDTCNNLEYAGTNLNTLLAQRSNVFKPSFIRMVSDIVRFNNNASKHLGGSTQNEITLGEYLDAHGYSREFREQYLIPMSAAIWSSSLEDMLNFPAQFLVKFFDNHGLLNISQRPQWRVIKGGSKNYIPALTARYSDKIRLETPVKAVSRISDNAGKQGLIVSSHCGDEFFDQVVFACHSDQALNILKNPSPEEQSVLGAIPYRRNKVVLHTDIALMPKRRRCWSSWNVSMDANSSALTYYMNLLQGLDCDEKFLVTLNPNGQINPAKIIDTFEYDHPIFSIQGIQAQKRWHEINGIGNISYCGAYWRNGFHEDGVWSALRVAKAIDKTAANSVEAA